MSVALPSLCHVGIAVAGVKAAAADFEGRWGAPMYRVNAATFPAARFRGQPVELSAGYEFFNTGASEIEVVSTPSPDTGFPGGNGGDGVHRLACIVDATGPSLHWLHEAGAGATLLLGAATGTDGRFVCLEGTAHGPVIELIELSEQMRQRAQATGAAKPVMTTGIGWEPANGSSPDAG